MRSILKNLSAVSLLLTSFSLSVFAQIDTSQSMPLDPNVKIGRLTNGLTYYIRKNTKPEKRVELRLVVNAGSILEDSDQLGLAHFMEHMNFNGTKHFPKNELVSYLQSIGVEFGADLNAYTSFDETVYILPVPTDKPELVDKGLQILEDWSHEALLDSTEIDKERGVVIEEWRLSRGADERMMRQTMPVQYQGSKYAERLPIGKKEVLEHFNPDALRRFYKQWYRPDLEAVVVVGDIDVNEIEQKIKEYFGVIPVAVNPRIRESFPVPDHKETLTVVARDKETAFPSVEILFKKDKEEERTVGDYCRYVNHMLFTNMLNSRFQEMALKPNPPFIGAGSFYGETYARTKDAYELFANVSDTGISNAITALLEENRRVLLYGFTDAELDRQKKQLLSFYERSFNERDKNESFKYTSEYISNYLTNEPTPGIEWEYDFMKQYLPAVKLEDINKLAAQWITRNNMVVTVNAPDKEGITIPGKDDIDHLINSAETAKLEPYKEKIISSELLSKDKLKPGRIISEKTNEELETTTIKLSNGVTVIVKPTTFKNNEILVRGFSKGGNSLVKDADYYSAINAVSIVQQSGVGGFSAADLSKALKGKNTSLAPNMGQLTEGVNGSTTPKDIETLLQLIHLYFTDPRKDKDAFNSYITRQKQLYKNLASNPQFYYSGEYQKIMTQNNFRGGQLPKPEDLDKVDFDKAIQIYKERFADASDFTFFFIGSVDTTKLKPLLETYLGSLPSKNSKENFKDLGIRPPKGMVDKTVFKGTEPQSIVSITFTGPAKYDTKDAYALNCLADVMNIKLVEKLREEKGEVYGVGSEGMIAKYPYSNYNFSISFPCAPENIDTLTAAALAELKKIQQNGVTKEDLEKIKEQQKRKLEVDLKQNQFWMNALYEAYYLGNNPNAILTKEKQIEGLTSKMIQDAANKFINLKQYIRISLKPENVTKEEKKPF